jgi:hypothetical protein
VDGPKAVIDPAEDGTPFVDLRGWECRDSDTLNATREQAEWCSTAAQRKQPPA